jgi:phosphatidylglycerophosphate synthase
MTDGEDWTREVLAELRAGRFRLGAWARFLARSFVRARERRSERPREHRAVVATAAIGSVAWLSVIAAGHPRLALAGTAWWLLQTAMLDWHLGLLERPDGSRLDRIGIANLVTLTRGGLPPALLALAGAPAGLVLLLLAGGVDVVDGRLARRRNEETVLGVWLDGSSDTFVLGAATLGAALHGLLPAWAAALVLLRLALPWALAAGAYFGRAQRPRLDGIAAYRSFNLTAGAILFGGLVLAFLHHPEAAPVAAAGTLGGIAGLGLAAGKSLGARGESGPRAMFWRGVGATGSNEHVAGERP